MSLLLAMLLVPAHGGDWLAAHVQGAAQVAGEHDTLSGVGLRFAGAHELTPRVLAELSLEGQGQQSGVGRVGAYAGLRFMASPIDRRVINPSLFAGAGAWGPDVHPLAVVHLDVDVPVSAPAHLRIGVSARSDVDTRLAFGVHLGVVARVGHVRARTLAGEVESNSVASGATSGWSDASTASASNPTQGADNSAADGIEGQSGSPPSLDPTGPSGRSDGDVERVWDPRQCMYVGAASAAPIGSASAHDGRQLGESERGAPHTAQGWLMVVASPGDIVSTGEIEQVVGKDGLARLRVPEGVIDVSIVGGGRQQRFEAAVADRFALWLRAEPPNPTLMRFSSGSSELSAANQASLNTLSRRLGRWTLQIVGSYSAEGDRSANERLAERRADSVERALRAAGVTDLRRLPAARPRSGLSVQDQRAVYITPVAPGESP